MSRVAGASRETTHEWVAPWIEDGWRRVTRAPRVAGAWLFGYDAFLSHAHADGAIYARELFEDLERRGCTGCLDAADFLLGDQLDASLRKVHRSGLVILLDTPAARASPWVAKEIAYAVRRRTPIARICLDTPEPIDRDTTPPDWPHLTGEEAAYLAAAISRRERRADGDAFHLRTVVATDLIRSVRVFTTRRRLRLAIAGLLAAAIVSGAAVAARRVTEWQLQAAHGRAESPGRPLATQLSDARRLVSGWWAPLAQWFHPEAFDAVVETFRERSLIAARPAWGGPANDATARCQILQAPSDRLAIADARTADQAVVLSADTLTVWALANCRSQALPLPPAERRDEPTPSLASPNQTGRLAVSETGRVAIVWWPRRLVRVALDDEGPRVTDVWVPPESTESDPHDITRAWISASGKVIAVALGTDRQASEFYVATAGLRWQGREDIETLTDLAIDRTDTFVITADRRPLLEVRAISDLQMTEPSESLFRWRAAAERLLVPAIGGLVIAAANQPVDDLTGGVLLTAFDLPTLTTLGQSRLVWSGEPTHLAGEVRYRRPAAVTVGASEAGASETGACQDAMTSLSRISPTRDPVLDYRQVRLLAASPDCSIVIVGGDPAHPSLIEALARDTGFRDLVRVAAVEKASTPYVLRYRRRVPGLVDTATWPTDGELDRMLVRSRFSRALPLAGPHDQLVAVDVPWSRHALAVEFKESADDVAHWSLELEGLGGGHGDRLPGLAGAR